jgi:hypothetical protein
VDTLVNWGRSTLTYLDSLQDAGHCENDLKVIHEKLGWLLQYRDHLVQWQELIDVVKSVEEYIKFIGLYPGCHIGLSEQLDMALTTRRANNVRNELVGFVQKLSLDARDGERLFGSSEIIESVIGKLKSLEQDQSGSGFTGMLLSLPAMLSRTTQDVIQKALESVPTKKVFAWVKENIGQSVQSKKKEVLSAIKNLEQKWDQNQAACEG